MLDLRDQAELSTEDSRLIDDLKLKIIDSYNNYIETLVKVNNLKKFSLLLSVANRNPNSSSLLNYFSKIVLLDHKIRNQDIPERILVSNNKFAMVVKQMLKKNFLDKSVVIESSGYSSIFHRVIKNIFVSTYLIFNSWFFSRVMLSKPKLNDPIIYVDNFIFKDSFDSKGAFFDRYYSGYEKFLSRNENSRVWFCPTLIDFKFPNHFFKIWKNYKLSNYNFLFEESWLSLRDSVTSLYLSLFTYRAVKKIPKYKSLNISPIVRNELLNEIASPGLVKAMNKYFFISNLNKEGVKILKIINWHENQNIDRALNMGFHEFYPDVDSLGYQGYTFSSYEAHKNPLPFEVSKNTIPKKISVISEYARQEKLKYCKSLEVNIAPALRFSYIHDAKLSNDSGEKILLAALPIQLDQCNQIINFLLSLDKKVIQSYKVLVKIHPSFVTGDFINKVPGACDEMFSLCEEKISDIIDRVSFVLSSASSVCSEAVSLGIPVAIIANKYGITQNPIPESFHNKLWRIVYDKEDLNKFLINSKKSISINPEQLFHKPNKKEVREFFCAPELI